MNRKTGFGLAIAALAVVAGFVVVVLPLFMTGPESGDLTGGNLPTSGKVGQPVVVQIGIDNTGASTIAKLCIKGTVDSSMQLQNALFQNIDTVSFIGDSACGGALSPGESTNVSITFLPNEAGTYSFQFRLLSGTTPLGSPLGGPITVTS